MLAALLLPLLTAVNASPARAESDLCTYGWARDVHPWLSHPKETRKIKNVFCGKNARRDANRAAAQLAHALAADGYTVTVAPHVQEIELDAHPSFELIGAMVESKCRQRGLKSVLAVCLSIKESAPRNLYGKPGIGPPPGTGPGAPPRNPRDEGQRPAM